MTAIVLLGLAALVCVLVGLLLLFLAIKYKDEDFAWILAVGIFMVGGGACWCVQEAVKRADNERVIRVDEKPTQP